MGMTIVTAKIRNNGSMIYCLGDTNLIPGAEAQEVNSSYLEHPEVKAAVEKGHLTVIEGGQSTESTEGTTDAAASTEEIADTKKSK